MSDPTVEALENLERIHDDLDAHTAYIIKALIKAELPCREYDSEDYLEKLADAVHSLWNHLCQLDTQNLAAWDIGVWELASLYGASNNSRTFPREPKGEDKVLLALGDMIERFEKFVDVAAPQHVYDGDLTCLNRAKEVYDEAERWPTTGSEESFSKLSSTQMLRAGFRPDNCTQPELDVYMNQCSEEGR